MKPKRKTVSLLKRWTSILAALVMITVSSSAQELPGVPRWQPRDFEFSAKVHPSNPFRVFFNARVTGPERISFVIPGFFDGGDTWKVRVSPTIEGCWSLETESDIPELNGKKIEFTCVHGTNPNVHGILRVDKEHPHHFVFDDGTKFFMQAYEYDWLWALDMDKSSVPTVEKSLDLIGSYGFNYVIMDSYAYDTKWRPGISGPDDYGPPMMCPWMGTNADPDYSRMNFAYWQHYDRVMAALYERGIEAHMLIKVYNKEVHWPAHNTPEEQLFFRWLVARYSAYPNIIWDFSKEAHKEPDLAYKQHWLEYIRSTDPYHHLMTVHDDDRANDSGAYDKVTDFRADQQHRNYHATILRQRARRAWPVANVESDYECGPGGVNDKTYGQAQTTEQTIRTLWEIAMAGGYTAYYYTYTAWDVIRPLDLPPGYSAMKHFGDFWRSTKYWLLEPSDTLVTAGWCLANKGQEYVVYLNTAQPFRLNVEGATAMLSAEWFDPFTGSAAAAGSGANGMVEFSPPSDWGRNPVVLHLWRR
jgi:hypothetical protein